MNNKKSRRKEHYLFSFLRPNVGIDIEGHSSYSSSLNCFSCSDTYTGITPIPFSRNWEILVAAIIPYRFWVVYTSMNGSMIFTNYSVARSYYNYILEYNKFVAIVSFTQK